MLNSGGGVDNVSHVYLFIADNNSHLTQIKTKSHFKNYVEI